VTAPYNITSGGKSVSHYS